MTSDALFNALCRIVAGITVKDIDRLINALSKDKP